MLQVPAICGVEDKDYEARKGKHLRRNGNPHFTAISYAIKHVRGRGFATAALRSMLKMMGDSLTRLYEAVRDSRSKDPAVSRTARLLRAGRRKIAKKVAEEAAEVALDAAMGKRQDVVRESADLIYNLIVLWVETGISLQDVWDEMDRRERLLGIAEKMPKTFVPGDKLSIRPLQPPRAKPRRARVRP
jgi:phosphoribosyl-ATP pyrophosphohydrolase